MPDDLSRGGIEAYRDVVEIGRKEACVVIECRCSRLMAKQACNGDYRGSRVYGERRGGVAQVVRSDLQTHRGSGYIKAVAAKVAVSERRGVRGRAW